MFLRIFRYRVRPEMRDRHLAIQARAAKIYQKHVADPPTYFRASGDPNQWVELHWYADRQACKQVADAVGKDLELARLWKEFHDTLDSDYPSTLEECSQYEIPAPVGMSPFAQPPIDAAVSTSNQATDSANPSQPATVHLDPTNGAGWNGGSAAGSSHSPVQASAANPHDGRRADSDHLAIDDLIEVVEADEMSPEDASHSRNS